MKKYIFAILLSLPVFSSAEVLYGVSIVKIYAQSTTGGSEAHLIKLSADLPESCNGDRVYVDFEDTAMFSLLLAKHIAGQTVDVIYSQNQEPKTALGHLPDLECKLISVF